MCSESNLNSENHILTCPFDKSCHLPKMRSLCHFPDYKLCPDYEVKLHKLKSTSRSLL